MELLDYIAMYDDGICNVRLGRYSVTLELSDINYQAARLDEKKEISAGYGQLLNALDPSVHWQITVANRSMDQEKFRCSMLYRSPEPPDEIQPYRAEMNEILTDRASEGQNNIIREKYVTLTADAADYESARPVLARLTAEDMESLQHYEERLTALEEVLLAQQAEDFDKKIFRIRRELSVLAGYYAQLDDLYAVLADAIPDAEEHVQRLLEHLSGKAQRLLTMTEQEKEYSLQLREMHQTQVDMRQNQIMKILTIVTTVFLPLSLIAGWYGMNFRNMPELSAEHGYLVICIISVVCVLVELWIFKRKKWF